MCCLLTFLHVSLVSGWPTLKLCVAQAIALASAISIVHTQIMSADSKQAVAEKDLVEDIAYARKPYDEVVRTAEQVGLLGVAAEIKFKADRAEQRVVEIAESEEHSKKKLEERQAFSKLCDETDEDILTQIDFKITHPTRGPDAWEKLEEQLRDEPSASIRFIEYYPDTFALVGNVSAAAAQAQDPDIAPILQVLAEVLKAQRPIDASR